MDLEIHYAEEWAALYRDGQLVRVGDTYRTDEEAFKLLGVEIVQDDAFMRGQNSRDGVAQTLDQVDEYRWARENKQAEAERLRKEAEEMIRRAAELDGRP